MSSIHNSINAWREILARTFEGFAEQNNVSPDWLVNPATKRRLKLDVFYPEAGVAVRFLGLTAKGQGRQSDEDVQESAQRDQTRADLCRQQGVQLVTVEPLDDPLKQTDSLISSLSRSSRLLAQGDQPAAYKQKWMPRLSTARTRAEQVRSLIGRNTDQMMTNLADSWREREAKLSTELSLLTPLPTPKLKAGALASLAVDQRVRHERYGDGVITALVPTGEDAQITILFDAAQERTFLASLVQDKLTILTE